MMPNSESDATRPKSAQGEFTATFPPPPPNPTDTLSKAPPMADIRRTDSPKKIPKYTYVEIRLA